MVKGHLNRLRAVLPRPLICDYLRHALPVRPRVTELGDRDASPVVVNRVIQLLAEELAIGKIGRAGGLPGDVTLRRRMPRGDTPVVHFVL